MIYRYFFLSLPIFCVIVNISEFLVKNNLAVDSIQILDEIYSIIGLFLMVLYRPNRNSSWINMVKCFIVYSIIFSCAQNVYYFNKFNLFAVIIQTIINVKFFLLGFVFLCAQNESQKIINASFYSIIGLTVIGLIANIFVPQYFEYSSYSYEIDRNRLVGFQFKPNDMGLLAAFVFSSLMCVDFTRINKYHFVAGFCSLILVAVSTSRTALMIIFVAVFFNVILRKKYMHIFYGVIIFGLWYLIFRESIENSFFYIETVKNVGELNFSSGGMYIRAIILDIGINILTEKFPFGYGAGNFATVMSVGSPVYEIYNVAGMDFFEKMEGVFDSNFASIAGEYGAVGVLAYAILAYFMVRQSIDKNISSVVVTAIIFTAVFSQQIFSYQVNAINLILPFLFLSGKNMLKHKL